MVERKKGYLSFGAVFRDPLSHDLESCRVVTNVNMQGGRIKGIITRRIFYGPDPEKLTCISLRSEYLLSRDPVDIIDYWTIQKIMEAAKRSCEVSFRGCRDKKFREAEIKTALARLDLEIHDPLPKPKSKPKLDQADPEKPIIISRATRARWLRS